MKYSGYNYTLTLYEKEFEALAQLMMRTAPMKASHWTALVKRSALIS